MTHGVTLLSGSRDATRLIASAPSAMIQAASTAYKSVRERTVPPRQEAVFA